MEQFISEHGGVIVSGIVTIALLGIIMTVILAVGNMDAYEISKIIGDSSGSIFRRTWGKYYIRINRAGYGSDHNSGNKQRHC